MKYNAAMIDIETLAVTRKPVIFQIGLVLFKEEHLISPQFDPSTPLEGSIEHHRLNIQIEDCILHHDAIKDASTEQFWNERGFPETYDAGMRMQDAMPILSDIYKNSLTATARTWANGPVFDLGFLERYYHDRCLPAPWHFRYVRDCRTARAMARQLGATIKREENSHDALEDCIGQLQELSLIYRFLASKNNGKVYF